MTASAPPPRTEHRDGYLCDVYVLEAHRGRGRGEWLVGFALADPALQATAARRSGDARRARALRAVRLRRTQEANAYMDIVRRDIYLAEAGSAGPVDASPTPAGEAE